VILTAYPSHDVMSEGLRIGIDSMIQKPWDDEGLKSAIRRLISESTRPRTDRLREEEETDPSPPEEDAE